MTHNQAELNISWWIENDPVIRVLMNQANQILSSEPTRKLQLDPESHQPVIVSWELEHGKKEIIDFIIESISRRRDDIIKKHTWAK